MLERSSNQILNLLKFYGPQTAQALSNRLGTTAEAVRQHLTSLKGQGLVEAEDQRGTVGRPRRHWHLTAQGHGRFPDSHAVLSADILKGVVALFGDAGLDRLIAEREKTMKADYSAALVDKIGLEARAQALAFLRSREGYLAEVIADEAVPGDYMLIERHCPICVAAQMCQGFCRSELALFQAVLGPGVDVRREEHILEGALRCVYRLHPL